MPYPPALNRRRSGTEPAERGAGTISSAFGLLFLVGFLTVMISVLIALYRSSMLTALAHDAAHAAADAPGPGRRACGPGAIGLAERRATELGAPGVTVEARCQGTQIVVSVSAANPSLLAALGEPLITRTATVRIETRVEP
ncbi:MAG: hypothetical protein OEY23_26830 [Acidimicrobiia bacterium]|nr:hypothetical protein [Acidimicrobiia bacterium]